MLDIETSGLKANFGRMLCACVKDWHGEVKTFSQADYPSYASRPWDDRKVVRDTIEELSKYHIWVTYYGTGFDIPFLRSRMVLASSPNRNPYEAFHVDLYYKVRNLLQLGRNSLYSAQQHLGLADKKTPLGPKIWLEAGGGSTEALDNIVEHCQQDVIVTEQLYDRFLPFMKTMGARQKL